MLPRSERRDGLEAPLTAFAPKLCSMPLGFATLFAGRESTGVPGFVVGVGGAEPAATGLAMIGCGSVAGFIQRRYGLAGY